MMSFPHHMGKALSAHQCLLEEQKEHQSGGREFALSPSSDKAYKHPQVILLREEWIKLTGDPIRACVLEKMVHWSRKVQDFDLYLKEETASSLKSESSPQYGWFYKSNEDLIAGCLLRVTVATFRRYLYFLMDRGWIQRKITPISKWHRTSHYRVNLRKLNSDLQKQGYYFPDFTLYERLFDSSHELSNSRSAPYSNGRSS